MTLKIINNNYSVEFIKESNTILFKGLLLYKSIEESNEISEFITELAGKSKDVIIFDLAQLEYINSSAIASLSLFFIKVRDSGIRFKLMASKYSNWQKELISNLQQINENIELHFVCSH